MNRIKLCFRLTTLFVSQSLELPDKQIKITELNRTIGLYFEAMGPVRTSFTNWDFVTYINLTSYYIKFQTLRNYVKETNDICLLLKGKGDNTLTQACVNFIQSTLPFSHEIELNFHSTMRILGSDSNSAGRLSRYPRGLVNAIGRIANVLFGICSDQDAEFFYNHIETLERSNEKYSNMAQEQIRIVSSVINNVNTTMHELVTDSQKLQSNIDILWGQSKQLLSVIDIMGTQNIFLEHTTILTVLLNQFAWETQNLQSVVNSALNGIMHTSVYPPSELLHELKTIQLSLPPTLELPRTDSHLAIPELFRVSTLSVVYVNQTLIFVTHIPLLWNIAFNLYHNIPLPITTSNGSFVIIDPETQYLAISQNNEYHFSLSENQYQNCKSLFSFKLCVGIQSINKHMEKENCEESLFNNPENSLEKCNIKYVNLDRTLWQKLSYQNAWLYYCNRKQITVACRQESYKFLLSGVGKIEIPDYCEIYTDNSILTPVRTITSESHRDFVPETPNISFRASLKRIIDYHVPQKLDTSNYYKNFNQLAQDARDLTQLQTLYKDSNKDLLIVKPEHHIILLYVVVIIIITLSLYTIVKYRCNIPKLYMPEIPEPQL